MTRRCRNLCVFAVARQVAEEISLELFLTAVLNPLILCGRLSLELPVRATFAVSVLTCADLYARSQQTDRRRAADLLGPQPWLKWQDNVMESQQSLSSQRCYHISVFKNEF